MDMDTCQLCQIKGPIEPCEFCGAHACSSDRRSGFCSVDEDHEMNWCMDCEKILAKRKRTFRLVCRDCPGHELPAALQKDIDRRYAKKDKKFESSVHSDNLRELIWNLLEFMQDVPHAHVIELDLEDFLFVADPDDIMMDTNMNVESIQPELEILGIQIEFHQVGPFDSGSVVINWSDDFDDILTLMVNRVGDV